MTKTIRVPLPNRGDGYRVIRGRDGRMTTVPLLAADVAMYRPLLAMDAAFDPNRLRAGNAAERANTAKTAPGTWDQDPETDLDTPNSAGDDLRDQIHQLLEGKLDDADIDMLIKLIEGDDTDAAPAQDRWLPRPPGLARDSKITPLMRQRVAQGAANRAASKQKEIDSLFRRFPALKNARVVG